MIALMGRSDPATSQAVQFAKGILDASATAFYEVDEALNLNRFLLSGIPVDFHRQYMDRMNQFDPLHPKRAANEPFARLSVATNRRPTPESTAYAHLPVNAVSSIWSNSTSGETKGSSRE